VSPRSADLLREALVRIDDARFALDADRRATALSTAYYAALYAARAALSEQGEHPRTHRGTWGRVFELLVEPGLLDADVHQEAAALQREREEADYEAPRLERADAEGAVAAAEAFVAAIARLLGPLPR